MTCVERRRVAVSEGKGRVPVVTAVTEFPYIEILGVDVRMLGQVEVLLGHEYALCKVKTHESVTIRQLGFRKRMIKTTYSKRHTPRSIRGKTITYHGRGTRGSFCGRPWE